MPVGVPPDEHGPVAAVDACAGRNELGLLEPRQGETCYEFRVHAGPGDPDPFPVPPGETYNEWYFAVPWPAGTVATRIASFADSPAAYFQTTFSTDARQAPDDVETLVTGTTLGTDARVLDMGGLGGCSRELPGDVGLELPSDGLIMV